MNIELTLALIVLFFGARFLINTLKSGSPESLIEKAEVSLEKSKKASNKKGAFIAAWLVSIVISILLIALSLSYIYSLS